MVAFCTAMHFLHALQGCMLSKHSLTHCCRYGIHSLTNSHVKCREMLLNARCGVSPGVKMASNLHVKQLHWLLLVLSVVVSMRLHWID